MAHRFVMWLFYLSSYTKIPPTSLLNKTRLVFLFSERVALPRGICQQKKSKRNGMGKSVSVKIQTFLFFFSQWSSSWLLFSSYIPQCRVGPNSLLLLIINYIRGARFFSWTIEENQVSYDIVSDYLIIWLVTAMDCNPLPSEWNSVVVYFYIVGQQQQQQQQLLCVFLRVEWLDSIFCTVFLFLFVGIFVSSRLYCISTTI